VTGAGLRDLALTGALGLGTLLCAGCPDEARAKDVEAAVEIRGFTLEAASGEPLPGVLVEGPRELRATSDESGRFVLTGLLVGESGVLHARDEAGGLAAELPFTALEAEGREVVFHLREARR